MEQMIDEMMAFIMMESYGIDEKYIGHGVCGHPSKEIIPEEDD